MNKPNSRSITYFLASAIGSLLLGQSIYTHASFSTTPGDGVSSQAIGMTSDFGKWTAGIVPWVYNPTGAPPGFTDSVAVRDLIEGALAEWSGVCDIIFVRSDTDGDNDGIDSTINIDQFPYDNIAVFQFDTIAGAGLAGPVSSSSTAAALGRWNYFDGTVRLSNTVFDQTGMNSAAVQRNLLAFDQTVIHEVGHLIGLGHSDQPVSIMYANPYNALGHLRQDDIENCRNIYGYSQTYTAPETYTPGAAGVDGYDLFEFVLASSGLSFTPITSLNDGTDDALGVHWRITGSPGYSDFLTQVVVDPQGYLSTIGTTTNPVTNLTEGQFSIASFDLLRELPGTWTVYIYDSTGLLETMTFDVNTSLPAIFNERPVASFSYSEAPDTRDFDATVTVTGDAEGHDVTIIWHMPGAGVTTVPLGGSSGSDTQSINLDNLLINEIFVEVNDNGVRYPGTDPGTGPAGAGFQNLFRYNSTDRNIGPDVDGDNSSDILWRNTATGKNWLYAMGGNTTQSSAGINTVATQWDIAGTGDYNGDGKSDILWRNSATGKNWIYLMDGSTVLSSQGVNTVADPLWEVVGNGDYNGDGNSDILWRHATTGQNWVYLMNGAVVQTSAGINTVSDPAWKVVGSGDYNGDGNSDILWRNTSTGKNWMYLMNGANVQTSAGINTVSDQRWLIVGSGDYNGDGNSDILWRQQGPGGSGSNFLYLMNGPTVIDSGGVRVLSDLAWQIVGSGDYDGDSDSDILWRNTSTGKNWIYFMDGLTRTNSVGINTVSAASPGWEVVNKN